MFIELTDEHGNVAAINIYRIEMYWKAYTKENSKEQISVRMSNGHISSFITTMDIVKELIKEARQSETVHCTEHVSYKDREIARQQRDNALGGGTL